MVGPKKQDFWPRIKILKGFFFLNLSMNYRSSKSAKIVLSKSIFDVNNQLNFFEKKIISEYQFRRPLFGKNMFF